MTGSDGGLRAVGVPDAVALAIVMHHAGELADAEKLYRRILMVVPEHPDAVHYLGILLHQRDRSDEAVELIARSLELLPTASRFNNFGNVLVERGDLEEAAAAYRRSLELDPDRADIHNNVGSLLNTLGRHEEARLAFEQALARDPAHVGALANLGGWHARAGRHGEAASFFMRSLEADPADGESRHRLGLAYHAMGEHASAAAVYEQWLQDVPDDPVAQHMAAATTGSPLPARAPDGYVARSFDAFAASFDAKLARLAYRAPALVAAAVKHAGLGLRGGLQVVDLGCGTRLCGPWLRVYAGRLVGVDLSARMLEAARVRGCYDELHHGEAIAFLREQAVAWDLIVAADTFCYCGDLGPAAVAIAAALAPAGLLVFSVEAARAGDTTCGYRLHPSGRYSHEAAYLRHTLTAAGLADVAVEPAVLRQENDQPVSGYLVAARQGPAPHRQPTELG